MADTWQAERSNELAKEWHTAWCEEDTAALILRAMQEQREFDAKLLESGLLPDDRTVNRRVNQVLTDLAAAIRKGN